MKLLPDKLIHYPISQLSFHYRIIYTMALTANMLLFIILLLSLIPDIITVSKYSTTTPPAFVLQVTKHSLNLRHTTTIYQRTPLVPINVAIDLSGAFLWVSCGSAAYDSATYTSPPCDSPQCLLARCSYQNSRNKCTNNTCIVYSENVLTGKVTPMKLSEEVVNMNSTNGLNPTSMVSIPRFLFLCAPCFHSKGLPFGVQGVAGLAHGPLGLLSQLSINFNTKRKFSMCFSPAPNTQGVLFFGDGPYDFSPGIDVSKLLIFTPLILMPKNKIGHVLYDSYEYYIKVSSIRINGKKAALNSSLLTKINSIHPYTILETSLYDSLTKLFIEEAVLGDTSRVAPIAPLDICFSTGNNNGEQLRLSMPVIDLVLQDENVFWRVFGLNSMVQMRNDTMCLGFLDGGLSHGVPITIGSYLLEDNLLQFDLMSSRLGFTNSLLLRETNCASFNFTTIV